MKLTLAEWRRARGISQEKMAEDLGVHINSYTRWEKNPLEIRYGNALTIANILNVSLDDILFVCDTTKNDNFTRKEVKE